MQIQATDLRDVIAHTLEAAGEDPGRFDIEEIATSGYPAAPDGSRTAPETDADWWRTAESCRR